MMGCVANFASMAGAMGREDPDEDYYEKCLGIISCILPIITNLSVITSFPSACVVNADHFDSAIGPGYICFLCSVILGNIPALFIHLALPAPDPKEIESKMEMASSPSEVPEMGSNMVTTV